MYTTLEAVMKLDYPKYEVLFALQDERDEALPVVRMVMEKYPDVAARVIIGELSGMVLYEGRLDRTVVG
jgi:ceramide glucosyltransferase